MIYADGVSPKCVGKLRGLSATIAILCLFSGSVSAITQATETTTQTFSVHLGASRVIFDPASAGATLTVSNRQDYPILVQSVALTENMTGEAPFVVTPPLMRLDEHQSSRLRIMRTGGEFSGDRESLQWLCVKGIPPKDGDAWAKDKNGKFVAAGKVGLNVQLSMNNCIKLLVRPATIKGQPSDMASHLQWSRHDNHLKAYNDSPFYMNLSSVKVDGVSVKKINYVAPFSSAEFTLPDTRKGGKIEWKIVNDYGGESRSYYSDVK